MAEEDKVVAIIPSRLESTRLPNKAIRKNNDKQSVIASHQQHSFPKKEILLLKETMISLGIRKDNFLTNERLLLIECLYNSGIIILLYLLRC